MTAPTTYSNEYLLGKLRAGIAATGSARRWAKANGFTPQYISDVLLGNRKVTARLGEALGFERMETMWKAVGNHATAG